MLASRGEGAASAPAGPGDSPTAQDAGPGSKGGLSKDGWVVRRPAPAPPINASADTVAGAGSASSRDAEGYAARASTGMQPSASNGSLSSSGRAVKTEAGTSAHSDNGWVLPRPRGSTMPHDYASGSFPEDAAAATAAVPASASPGADQERADDHDADQFAAQWADANVARGAAARSHGSPLQSGQLAEYAGRAPEATDRELSMEGMVGLAQGQPQNDDEGRGLGTVSPGGVGVRDEEEHMVLGLSGSSQGLGSNSSATLRGGAQERQQREQAARDKVTKRSGCAWTP